MHLFSHIQFRYIPILEKRSINENRLILTMFQTFFINFSDPPGPPEITGYIEGETILLGQTVTLVCKAAGGNPLAEISWYR